MGLARKGSRKITVDRTQYRWVLSPDSGYVVLVVELLDSPGQRLEAYSDLPSSITPSFVARVIRLALRQNWQPAESGLPPFRIGAGETLQIAPGG